MKQCKFDGCNHPSKVKGWCKSHYQQQWRGEELRPVRRYKKFAAPARGKKICTRCERVKDRDEDFYVRPNGVLLSRCKTCTIELNTANNVARRLRKEAEQWQSQDT